MFEPYLYMVLCVLSGQYSSKLNVSLMSRSIFSLFVLPYDDLNLLMTSAKGQSRFLFVVFNMLL